MKELRAQRGPQEEFLCSPVDIAIYGGAAGGGKSYALLLDPLRHIKNPRFRAIIFRRTAQQLKLQGGLWDTSMEMYGGRALPNLSTMEWRFQSGATVKFAGMEHEKDRLNFAGAQIPAVLFDELVQFEESQFWFMLSRLRSMSGVRGYMRGATNPDPDSWVRKFVDWWIDPDTGFAIPSRSGVARWFVRKGDALVWADRPEELTEKFGPESHPRSVTFIPSTVYDNPILMEVDPTYLQNLRALPRVDRERLLSGNWNIRAAAGMCFRREWFGIVDAAPAAVEKRVRFWDRAASEQRTGTDPDATVGLLLSRDERGIYYVEDVRKMFESAHRVDRAMRACAEQDGRRTMIRFDQDPGGAGKGEAEEAVRKLDGFDVRFENVTGSKEVRAKGVSSQAEAGNVKLVRGPWNNEFLTVLENFPDGTHDDEVDALSGAYGWLKAPTGAFDKAPAAVKRREEDEPVLDASDLLGPNDM